MLTSTSWHSGVDHLLHQPKKMQLFTLSLESTTKLIPWVNDAVRRSEGIQVRLFRELLVLLARLRRANPDFHILLRGQPKDYRDSGTQFTVIRPTAFREGKNQSLGSTRLRKAQECLQSQAGVADLSQQTIDDLVDPFVSQIVLQHYHIEARIDTPWVDLTDSPQIAVHFATQNPTESALYAFAIPRAAVQYQSSQVSSGPICFALGSFCPADALRPHFQAAYSLAIISDIEGARAHSLSCFNNDVSELLLCKFQINAGEMLGEIHQTFGKPQGHGIYPRESDDRMKAVCRVVGDLLNHQKS
jgi:hypothetical protein